jgi:hypothetical protein
MDSFVVAGNSDPRAADSIFASRMHLISGKGPQLGGARYEVLLSVTRGVGSLPPLLDDFEGGRTSLHFSEAAEAAG